MAVAELQNNKHKICYSFVMKYTKYTSISWLLAHTIFLLVLFDCKYEASEHAQ